MYFVLYVLLDSGHYLWTLNLAGVLQQEGINCCCRLLTSSHSDVKRGISLQKQTESFSHPSAQIVIECFLKRHEKLIEKEQHHFSPTKCVKTTTSVISETILIGKKIAKKSHSFFSTVLLATTMYQLI